MPAHTIARIIVPVVKGRHQECTIDRVSRRKPYGAGWPETAMCVITVTPQNKPVQFYLHENGMVSRVADGDEVDW